MADNIQDEYAFIIENCIISSSQEDILLRSNEIEFGNLGFGRERNEGGSPLVHCKVVRPLRCVTPEGVECNAGKLGLFDSAGEAVEFDEDGENRVKVEGVKGEKIECDFDVQEEENRVKIEGVEGEKIDGGTSKVDMEKVVGVDEKQGDCVKVDGETSKVDMEEIVVEKKEADFVEIDGEVSNTCNVDTEEVVGVVEKQGVRADVDGETIKVDMEEIVVEKKEADFVEIDEEVSNTCNVDTEEVVGVVEKQGVRAEVDGETSNVDMEEIVVEKKEADFVEIDEEVSNTCNVDMEEVVGVVEKQGVRAEVDGETSKVDMEEIVVKEMEVNFVEIDDEVNNTMVRDCEDASGNSPNKDVLRGENTRVNEEHVKGKKRKLPRSMFEQWGSGHGSREDCSKDASFERNESKKPLDGEASYRCILDALKFLVGEKSYGGNEDDFFETAKRLGMTFPRPRFRQTMEEDV